MFAVTLFENLERSCMRGRMFRHTVKKGKCSSPGNPVFTCVFNEKYYCTREASELLEVSVFLIRGRPADREQSPKKTIDFGPFFFGF